MKQKIIQKATNLFLNLGFKSVTMDDIANELGISKKTIYLHFKNKTALVKECTFSVSHRITNGIDSICSSNQNPIDEVFAIKQFISEQLQKEKSMPQYQLQKYYPEIFKTVRQTQFDKMIECAKNNISRGIQNGLYRKNMDPDIVARLYFLGMTGIRDEKLFPIKMFAPEYIIDEYLEYHLRGIVTEKGMQHLNQFLKENQSNEE